MSQSPSTISPPPLIPLPPSLPSDERPSTSSDVPATFPVVSPESGGDVEESQPPNLVRQQSSMSYRARHSPRQRSAPPYTSSEESGGDDTLSCVIVILTFWFFVSMTLIMGIFGSEELHVGPYSSILLKPNPLFIHYLKVEASEMNIAPVLYGFYKVPPLQITETWSESLTASVKPDSHEEWIYFLNEGSQIDISYNLPGSSSLLLIIAKGIDEMAEWIEDPSYSDGTFSWNLIHGSGTIRQDISKSFDYYVAVGNLNSEDVEVELNISVKSSMHNITNSYHRCNLSQGPCNLSIPFPAGNVAVLTTSGPLEGDGRDRVYVKLSYEPRWMTYFLGIGGMTSVMLWVFNFLKGRRQNDDDNSESQSADFGPERAPLLSHKDDDLSSFGSSYDSGSQNDEESQECLEEGLFEGRPSGESGKKYNSRQCVICFDAPKDCFFIPCGHCASCFSCGTRIAEGAGICPICRRKIKKVRRIYNV